MIRDYQALQHTWFAKGKQRIIKNSPQLNIVEGLWKWLKSDVINNVFYHTVAEIRNNVSLFMEHIMKDPMNIIDRLCIKL